MIDTFALNLILAFLVGGFWITLTTVVAERFGSRLGGLIGGLPSTSLVSFFFIGINQSAQAVTQASYTYPLAIGVFGLFVVSYAAFTKRGFWSAIAISLFVWFILAALIVILNINNLFITIPLWLLILVLSLYVLEKKMKIKSREGIKIKYRLTQIAGRALFSGAMICFTVFMSKVGGPIFGGIFTAFPALTISTFAITYKSVNLEFTRALTKPLLVSVMINTVPYVLAVGYLYPIYGVALGTIGAYLIALIVTCFTYTLVHKNLI